MITHKDMAELGLLAPRPLTPTEEAQRVAEIAASKRPVPSWLSDDGDGDDGDDD